MSCWHGYYGNSFRVTKITKPYHFLHNDDVVVDAVQVLRKSLRNHRLPSKVKASVEGLGIIDHRINSSIQTRAAVLAVQDAGDGQAGRHDQARAGVSGVR